LNGPPQRSPPPLEPLYYLKNFQRVVSTIGDCYADLLTAEESQFVNEFPRAPQSARALLARMVVRRGDLFRASKLNYAEIGNPHLAAAPLIEVGWVEDRPSLSIEQLQHLLAKPELVAALRLPRRYAAWTKDTLTKLLKDQFPDARQFVDWCPDSTDCIFALRVAPLCERFRVMFFGNHWQDWSEFVTADLKIFQYEKVRRCTQARPFQTRAQIEVFLQLQACRELIRARVPLDQIVQAIPPVVEDSDWLEDKRQEILFALAREYERAGDEPAALVWYRECTHRDARARAIRLHARAQQWASVHAMCLSVQDSPKCEAEIQFIRRVLPRACRKLDLAYAQDRAPRTIPQFDLTLDAASDRVPVEIRVRDHLAQHLPQPTTVRYVENDLVNALLGLLCWPAIFAPVAGAFFHDFHRGPADLTSRRFFERRRESFQECLAQLESERYRHTILTTFKEKWGIQNPFVRWHAIDDTVLHWALKCFPAVHLRLWFERILLDVQENRAGFPDLVQFWPEERTYRLIEVKGPGDRLQSNQRRLFEYFLAHEMPVALCSVRWRAASD
jgi:VRR-NUC domain